jgi:hypothetical protein
MTDQDLSGDDAKSVSYWITFVKPDLVATLQGMETETIDYATDAGSYGGLKLGEYLERLTGHRAPLPAEWKDLSLPLGYETDRARSLLLEIPESDRKYIKFNCRVNWRQPMPAAEREKDKVEVLREIREALNTRPTP